MKITNKIIVTSWEAKMGERDLPTRFVFYFIAVETGDEMQMITTDIHLAKKLIDSIGELTMNMEIE